MYPWALQQALGRKNGINLGLIIGIFSSLRGTHMSPTDT